MGLFVQLAEAAKAQFSRDHSDYFALVRAYEGWKVAEQALSRYEYCWKNFLSAQSMKSIDSLRREFLSLLKDTSVVKSNMVIFNAWNYDENLIRVVICYGLYPGISSIVHNEKSFSLKTVEDGQVLLHSIKVNSVFLRDTNVVSDSVLLLSGGSISKGDIDGHLKMLGGYLEFFMEPSLAEMYLNLRKDLDELFKYKIDYLHRTGRIARMGAKGKFRHFFMKCRNLTSHMKRR
ncbi:unnamed protein product [Lactuca virosa]|uniref:RNA helicase n=1 Tax=Lactuca virosa TaxID=75947 RepID=A0AAU9LNK5_9ASTR|nr:unnamed protein product [Lactuca virosa]